MTDGQDNSERRRCVSSESFTVSQLTTNLFDELRGREGISRIKFYFHYSPRWSKGGKFIVSYVEWINEIIIFCVGLLCIESKEC